MTTPSNYRKPRFPSSFTQSYSNSSHYDHSGHDTTTMMTTITTPISNSYSGTSSSSIDGNTAATCSSFLEFIKQYNQQCQQDQFIKSISSSKNSTNDCHEDDDGNNPPISTNATTANSSSDEKVPTTTRITKTNKDHNDNVGTHNQNIITSKNSMSSCSSQDIAMLEPYLAAFRKQLQQDNQQCQLLSAGMEEKGKFETSNTKENNTSRTNSSSSNSDNNSSSSGNIPPQLLRIIRFFPMKWHPIKRALLRPPMENELGVNIRLTLAKTMYDKQLISTAEYDALEQKVVSYQYHRLFDEKKKDEKGGRNIDTIVVDQGIAHDLKLAFSRLPLDQNKQNGSDGLHHLRSILEEYCHQYTTQDTIYNMHDCDDNHHRLPIPDQVAEWALLSFCGLVIANGIDDPTTTSSVTTAASSSIYHARKKSRHSTMESQLVVLMTNETSKTFVFVQAVKKRIELMLEPDAVNELSHLNILCLARFLSYLDVSVTDGLLAHGISSSFGLGNGMMGRSGGCGGGGSYTGDHGDRCLSLQLPKLMASYLCIMVNRGRRYDKGDDEALEFFSSLSFLSAFQGRIKDRLDSIMDQEEGGMTKNDLVKRTKFEKYTNLLFQTVEYLLLQ